MPISSAIAKLTRCEPELSVSEEGAFPVSMYEASGGDTPLESPRLPGPTLGTNFRLDLSSGPLLMNASSSQVP